MAQVIRLKRSAEPGKVPLVTDLVPGEVAINTFDGKMYILRNNGAPAIVEVTAGGTVAAFAEATRTFDTTTGPVTAIAVVPAGKVVARVNVIVSSPFDGAPTLKVGDTTNQSGLVDAVDVLLASTSTFDFHPNVSYGSDTILYLYLTLGGATSGSGIVTVYYQQ